MVPNKRAEPQRAAKLKLNFFIFWSLIVRLLVNFVTLTGTKIGSLFQKTKEFTYFNSAQAMVRDHLLYARHGRW